MKDLRVTLPRTLTVLFAGAVLLWAALDLLDWQPPAGDTPAQMRLLITGGVMAAPLVSPVLTLWFEQAD